MCSKKEQKRRRQKANLRNGWKRAQKKVNKIADKNALRELDFINLLNVKIWYIHK